MPQAETVTFKEFAALLGCRPSYVTQLRKEGRLVLTDDGKRVRVAESLARVEATRDPAMAAVTERHARQRGAELAGAGDDVQTSAPTPDDNQDPGSGDDVELNPDFQRWKARRERAAALREELRLAEEAGDLMRRGDAAEVVTDAFVTLRADLEGLRDSIAPTLAAESDEQQVRAILADEFEHVLRSCSGKLASRGMNKGGG
ncbi:MAG TPA: hypothetical protein PKZ76_17100 [Xanthomonadaceae bacterium]|nr:hypothetical protein [Xanthomonadaceae bacterium]